MLKKQRRKQLRILFVMSLLFAFGVSANVRLIQDIQADQTNQSQQPSIIKPILLPQNVYQLANQQTGTMNIETPTQDYLSKQIQPKQEHLEQKKQNNANGQQIQKLKNLQENLRAEIDEQKKNQLNQNKVTNSTIQSLLLSSDQNRKEVNDDDPSKVSQQVKQNNLEGNADGNANKKQNINNTPSNQKSDILKNNKQQKQSPVTANYEYKQVKSNFSIQQFQNQMAKQIEQVQKAIKDLNKQANDKKSIDKSQQSVKSQQKSRKSVNSNENSISEKTNNNTNTQDQKEIQININIPTLVVLLFLVLFISFTLSCLACWLKGKYNRVENQIKPKSYDQHYEFDEVIESDREYKSNANEGNFKNNGKNREGTDVFD